MKAKQRILDAVPAIATTKGLSHVTFAAIKEESGVSKSGILYHFGSKSEIVQALVDLMVENGSAVEAIGDDPSLVRQRDLAYARCNFDPAYSAIPLPWALAITTAPELTEELSDQARRIDALEADLPQDEWVPTMLTRLALDGLSWSDLIDKERFTPEERDELFTALVGCPEEQVHP
ncbi:TetR/AcrR family transcriptional regulator [Catenulispora rubra]|uniref:TetR/AcrR family transcriptional regulator n=1 Tax=Catenulispora rubra TaxID=280293 RepID=UPI001891F9EF|nr:TetR/AcrR family transcriptional regulator [Catenulispora rubra]